jgi:hypothetical protein
MISASFEAHDDDNNDSRFPQGDRSVSFLSGAMLGLPDPITLYVFPDRMSRLAYSNA